MQTILCAAAMTLVLGFAGGCKPSDDTTPAPSPPAAAGTDQDDYEDEGEFEMEGERRSRWRWKGSRQRCYYLVGNRCFEARAAACKAAKCGKRRCTAAGEAPATVSCGGE